MSQELETALAAFEAEIAVADKALKALKTALGKAAKAAKAGQIKDLDKALGAMHGAGAALTKNLETARGAWTFDAETHLADGAYKDELIATAKAAGVNLFEKDDRLYCYPMILRVAPKDLAVTVDRKPERGIRPTALVQALAARQKQPQKLNAATFLDMLLDAYLLLAPAMDKTWSKDSTGSGPVVPLAAIHEVLTLRPGQAREYPLPEFTRDVHLLDLAPDTRTSDGRRFTLPASTGSKGGKRLTMADKHGGERIYVGLAFHKD